MDRKRAAAALLALAACIACSAAAPTASNQTALELMDGPTEGCYYNFQHYGEGDRIMTNEPCLNCTCHNRMLMCYLRVCPFTKPIGQDCTVEKRADQCCPIVTCPDVPVDLLTSTSTSSPAEYGATGVGKQDKYGCSINGKYFSEGSKVPSTPNKPCEHCYCIRNMTTCVMQECTLHVDGCTPIYHKDVCCPVRYSCDHQEDETLLLDDMTTTVRPTPGFLLTTTTVMPVTQLTQDCLHYDQIFPDGTLIKTEKACEHCYCMKGDIVCVVQECGTPMENEGKNCTSLLPRHGQCCPDTYICESDDRGTELTTEIFELSTEPPRRLGVEGSGYRNEPGESFTETGTFETDIEGSGEGYATYAPGVTEEDVITEKLHPDIIDEILLPTTEKEQTSHITDTDKDQNTIPGVISDTESSNIPETIAKTTEANKAIASIDTKTTVSDEYKTEIGLISKEDDYITTESTFRKDDNSIISDEMLTIKEQEKLSTTLVDFVEETTVKDESLDNISTEYNLPENQSTSVLDKSTTEVVKIIKEKETTTDDLSISSSTETNKPVDELSVTPEEEIFTGLTTMAEDKIGMPETTSINPDINEIDENIPMVSSAGRIPGEGDCLLNGITYTNNTILPTSNNCHTSCRCISSIVKCDPIICSSPPEYVENMNNCQPIYDSPDACCPTYVCSAKETIPPESHNQMSGTESPKPISASDCNGQDCILNEIQKEVSETSSSCTSVDCINKPVEKQDKGDCGSNDCADETQKPINQDCTNDKCQVLPVVACEGENCINEAVSSQDSHKMPLSEKGPSVICDENGACKTLENTQDDECKDDICKKQEISETEAAVPSDCTGPECKKHEKPVLPPVEVTTEQNINEPVSSQDSPKTPDSDRIPSVICDENGACKTLENTQDDECKDDICKKQESAETEAAVPSDCTGPECKTHEKPVLPPIEVTTEQNINEPVSSQDSHKIPDSDRIPSVICDENGACKTMENTQHDECKDEVCKKQESTETEAAVPSDCTGPECKTYDKPVLPPIEETTGSTTEKVSNDIIQSGVTQSPLVTITEIPEKTTKTDENIPEITKEVNKVPSEKPTTISDISSDVKDTDTGETELPESPIIQSTSEKYDTRTTEKINIEYVTESITSQDSIRDKVTQVDETATDKEINDQETSEPTEIKSENQGDKMDITTEIFEITTDSNLHSTKHDEIYGTISELDTENQEAPTDIPKLNKNELLSTTETSVGLSEKVTTVKDVTEMYEVKEEKTEVPVNLSTVPTQTDKISTDYDKATETNELPQGTIEPNEQFVETHTEKEKTETPKLYETHDVNTEKNSVDVVVDVTQSSESDVTEAKDVTTDNLGFATESNIVPTELPQLAQTKLDQVIKDVTEIVTDKHVVYTELFDYITTKAEEITSEPSIYHVDVASKEDHKSEVTEELITEKVTVTESSDLGQFATKAQEIHTETPQQSLENIDDISSTPIIEKKIDGLVTERSSTEIIGSDITEKQETHVKIPTEHEQELHTTTYDELFNKDQKSPIDSSTELPTSFTMVTETTKLIKDQETYTEEPEKSITGKESDFSDAIINTTPETVKVSLTEVDQHFTEKSEITVTASTPSEVFIDDTRGQNTVQSTSNDGLIEVEEKDLEPHKQTTMPDTVLMSEATTITQELIQVTESHTKSPSEADEKPQESSTEIEKESPLQIDITDTTEHLSNKPDETYITPSTDAISQSEDIIEHYTTESQKNYTELIGESQSYVDSSTEPSVSQHELDKSTKTTLPYEEIEIMDKETTAISHSDGVVDKESSLFTESEVTSQSIEKTTASLISIDEKETEPQSYITESYINVKEQETVKTTSGLMIDDHVHETTEKSVSDEESLPQQTNEYIPLEEITEDITSQTLHDVSTEKTKIKDTFETLSPNYTGTTQSEFSTKHEELGVTDSALFDKEKEIVTEFPHSYITSEDLDKTSVFAQKDTKDENTNKISESEEDNQEKEITTPVSDVTDIKVITEAELPEKNEVGIESTTTIKLVDDQNVGEEQTVSDLYITESQTESSEKSKDEIAQQQDLTTDEIITTKSPYYLSTSHLQEQQTTLSSETKIPQQETTTEKQADQTEPVNDKQSTLPELHNTEGTLASTVKDGIINTEDEKATTTLLVDIVQVTSHSPEYQTTILESGDKVTTESPYKEISTEPSKFLKPEKSDESEVTEISLTDQKPTTISPETHHEIITDVEKSPESFDMVTTDTVTKHSPTERNEVDIVKHPSIETISTVKPTTVAEPNKYEDQEQVQKSTETPIPTEIHLLTEPTKVVTQDQGISVTESQAKGTETTESQYTTTAEKIESTTDESKIRDKEVEQSITDDQKLITIAPEGTELSATKGDVQIHIDNKDKFTTSATDDTSINIESTKPTVTKKEEIEQPEIYSTESSIDMQTEKQVSQKESDKITTESIQTLLPNMNVDAELPVPTEKNDDSYAIEDNKQTTDSRYKFTETTPFLVELEEHTHSIVDEITTKSPLGEIATTMLYEKHESQQPERGDQIPDDFSTHKDDYATSEPSKTTIAAMEDKEQPAIQVQEQIDESTYITPSKSETEIAHITEKIPVQTSTYDLVETKKDTTKYHDDVLISTTPQIIKDKDYSTESNEKFQTQSSTLSDVEISTDKDIHISSGKPEIFEEKITPELPKETTNKVDEETSTLPPSQIDNVTKPQEKPVDTTLRPVIPDVPKPEFIDEHNEEIPSPDFPPSGGYGQEPDYIDEDQAFGPGTCRYGGKVYVSAQQIPRDDPCDFCFCFRSDIICLQQSCPPPIHGCHEEPIQGFCCPRYECPVSMATTLNVTTTTTTTTTTLPPHFLPHAYKGAAQRRGCQIKGHTYKVGEVVRASSGPCLHCTCGGDGQMKCDPKACTPEPMLRQMIAAAVSAKRRR